MASSEQKKPLALTKRELEVLLWSSKGLSARDVGQMLDIAKRTVDEHVQTAARKLGAANKTEAVATALREGLIDGKPL
ncbi:MAG: LuxR C-terminal-related transcriptional regulator [Pseudolabrys sp.]